MKIKLSISILCFLFVIACSKSEEDSSENALQTPTTNQASDAFDNGFKAKWNFVSGAEKYLIDVSTSANFATTVANYKDKSSTQLFENVIGLEAATQYYYRIRAVKGSQISGYSNVITVITTGTPIEDPTFLKVKANALPNPFFVGVAVKTDQLTTGSAHDIIIKNEFSSISAEYEMKMNPISTGSNSYNWTAADKIVKYGNDNGINVHGHALVWHNAVPNWLKTFSGTNAEFTLEVKKYITDVVTRYAGKVKSWDVVNEAVDDGSGGNMRNTIFLQKMGPNYIRDCFQWAREAANAAGDTNLLLFYNDYATSDQISKQNKVFDIVNDLKNSNLIDGVGFQMHNTYLTPTKAQMEIDINRHVALGLKIHISEYDLTVNQFNDITTFTNERRLAQKAKFTEIVKIYNALPAKNKYAFTVWGLRDNDSWIPFNVKDLNRNWNDWPLMYDSNFKIKSAHTGFLEGLN
jgi:endo-1,4-beta-xylanase